MTFDREHYCHVNHIQFMNSANCNFVIGICSPSGGGKTTLVSSLSKQIDESVVICFDDYGDPFWDITNFDDWITHGANLNDIATPQLAADLKNLKHGNSIISPKDHKVLEPKNIILFDTLVGRSQSETGMLIDFLVYIDVSLELALARRLLRTLSAVRAHELDVTTTQNTIERLEEYLTAYSSQSGPRQIYSALQTQAKPSSDLVLNGEHGPDILVDTILSTLTQYSTTTFTQTRDSDECPDPIRDTEPFTSNQR